MILLRIHCRSNLRMCRDVNAPNTGAFRLLLWIHFREHFPRPQNPCHTPLIPPRIHRKALRRGGGGALGGEGREPSPRGPAENGLPPATRGKRRGVGSVPWFHPRTARRACLCGTQGGRDWRTASASSAGVTFFRERQKPFRPERERTSARSGAPKPEGNPPGNRRRTAAGPGLRRETRVAGKNHRTGR